jgi:hypothetical protein
MKLFILILILVMPGLPAAVTYDSLLAEAYAVVPCGSYAGGCLAAQPHVPSDLEFDRYAATSFIRQHGYPSDWVGVMTPVDVNSEGWIVGGVLYYCWDEEWLGEWDGVSEGNHAVVGQSGFVYQPGVGVVCCVADFPFQIYAIDDDGYIFTSGPYGGGLWHVSMIDYFPSSGTALQPNILDVYSEDETVALPYLGAYFGRSAEGVLFAGGYYEPSMQWALVPIEDQVTFAAMSIAETPEPGTYLMVGIGLVALGWLRQRRGHRR